METGANNNQVVLEGVVVRRWTLDGDTFLRLAVRRQRGLPANPDGKNFDGVNVRLNYFLAQPAELPGKGAAVRVAGFLQQRDTQESLRRALERAVDLDAAAQAALLAQVGPAGDQVKLRRSETEIVALQWEPVQLPERRPRRERPPAAPRPPEGLGHAADSAPENPAKSAD